MLPELQIWGAHFTVKELSASTGLEVREFPGHDLPLLCTMCICHYTAAQMNLFVLCVEVLPASAWQCGLKVPLRLTCSHTAQLEINQFAALSR